MYMHVATSWLVVKVVLVSWFTRDDKGTGSWLVTVC